MLNGESDEAARGVEPEKRLSSPGVLMWDGTTDKNPFAPVDPAEGQATVKVIAQTASHHGPLEPCGEAVGTNRCPLVRGCTSAMTTDAGNREACQERRGREAIWTPRPRKDGAP